MAFNPSTLVRCASLASALLLSWGCGERTIEGPPPADHGERPDQNTDPLAARVHDLGMERIPSYAPEGDAPIRGELAEGRYQDYPFVLVGTRCYVAVAAGGEGVEELDITLINPHGAPMLRDEDTGRDAAFGLRHAVCPDVPGSYEIRVRMTRGSGEYALRMYGDDRI